MRMRNIVLMIVINSYNKWVKFVHIIWTNEKKLPSFRRTTSAHEQNKKTTTENTVWNGNPRASLMSYTFFVFGEKKKEQMKIWWKTSAHILFVTKNFLKPSKEKRNLHAKCWVINLGFHAKSMEWRERITLTAWYQRN